MVSQYNPNTKNKRQRATIDDRERIFKTKIDKKEIKYVKRVHIHK